MYDDLHGRQLAADEAASFHSATRILDILFQDNVLHSALDVGCGLGTCRKALLAKGVRDLTGVDATWLDPAGLLVEPA